VALSPRHASQFDRYAFDLIEWNRRVNLTAIIDPIEIARKHFLDSLSVIPIGDPRPGDQLIDVGSGAGFPGLPFAIVRPDVRVTLLEATRRKCDFLRHIVAALELNHVAIVQARAEDAGRDPAHRERYDLALARAVAEMSTLAEYTLPFVRVGGRAVAQKSGDVNAEVDRAQAAIAALGGRLQRMAPLRVPGIDEPRYAVIIEKVAPTPDKYPRRAGTPGKRPIR